MDVSKEMEIRNLPVSVSQNLAKFFEGDDTILSLLMGNIPKDLENPHLLRFTSTDIDSIRNHAQQLVKSPILILLDEWSTMGRPRPRLHHLLALLVKCQLFRAAEYVAQLIDEPEPERPTQGPAARVDISLPDDIEIVVNGMDYPYSSVEANRDQADMKPPINPPMIRFETDASSAENNVSIPFIRPPQATTSSSRLFQGQQSTHKLTSDLIKFSKDVASRQPSTSVNAEPSQLYIPALSALQNSVKIPATVKSITNVTTTDYIPALSGLMLNENSRQSEEELPAVLGYFETRNEHSQAFDGNVPSFSKIFSGGKSSQIINSIRSSTSSSDSDA